MKKIIESYKRFWLADASFIALSLLLFFVIFVLPILADFGWATESLVNLMLTTVFLIGIGSTNNKLLLILACSLFAAHLSLKLLRFSNLPFEFPILERVLISLNILLFIFINFRLLFRDDEYNFHRVIGAINVYLLFAFWGAFQFQLIHTIFGASIKGGKLLSGADFDYPIYVYYSLTSLTTVGYGDYFPVNAAAKMQSVFLSSIGIIYPAVVIARLVSLGKAK